MNAIAACKVDGRTACANRWRVCYGGCPEEATTVLCSLRLTSRACGYSYQLYAVLRPDVAVYFERGAQWVRST